MRHKFGARITRPPSVATPSVVIAESCVQSKAWLAPHRLDSFPIKGSVYAVAQQSNKPIPIPARDAAIFIPSKEMRRRIEEQQPNANPSMSAAFSTNLLVERPLSD